MVDFADAMSAVANVVLAAQMWRRTELADPDVHEEAEMRLRAALNRLNEIDEARGVPSLSVPSATADKEDCACGATMFDQDQRIIVRGPSGSVCHTRVEGEECFEVGEPRMLRAEDVLAGVGPGDDRSDSVGAGSVGTAEGRQGVTSDSDTNPAEPGDLSDTRHPSAPDAGADSPPPGWVDGQLSGMLRPVSLGAAEDAHYLRPTQSSPDVASDAPAMGEPGWLEWMLAYDASFKAGYEIARRGVSSAEPERDPLKLTERDEWAWQLGYRSAVAANHHRGLPEVIAARALELLDELDQAAYLSETKARLRRAVEACHSQGAES